MQKSPHKLDTSRLAVLDRIADRTMGARRFAQGRVNELNMKRHSLSGQIERLQETVRLRPGNEGLSNQLAAKMDEFERLARPLEEAISNLNQMHETGDMAGNLAAHTRDWAIDAGLIKESDR